MKYLTSSELKEYAKKFYNKNEYKIEYRISPIPNVSEMYLGKRCIGLHVVGKGPVGIKLYTRVLYGIKFIILANRKYRICNIAVIFNGDIMIKVNCYPNMSFSVKNHKFKVLNSLGESVYTGSYDEWVEFCNSKEEFYDITVVV